MLGFRLIDYFRENPPAHSIESSVGIADHESIDLILPEAVKHTLRTNAKRG